MHYLEEIIPYALSEEIIPDTLSGRDYPLCVIWKILSPKRHLKVK